MSLRPTPFADDIADDVPLSTLRRTNKFAGIDPSLLDQPLRTVLMMASARKGTSPTASPASVFSAPSPAPTVAPAPAPSPAPKPTPSSSNVVVPVRISVPPGFPGTPYANLIIRTAQPADREEAKPAPKRPRPAGPKCVCTFCGGNGYPDCRYPNGESCDNCVDGASGVHRRRSDYS